MKEIYTVDNITNIFLGYNGEKDTRKIYIDVSKWLEEYPQGNITIIHNRPTETKQPYIVADVTLDNNILVWTISSGDVGIAGTGLAIIQLNVDDKIKKSAVFTTKIGATLDGTVEPTPPEPYQSWVDLIIEKADEILDAQAESFEIVNGHLIVTDISGQETDLGQVVGADGTDGLDGFSPTITIKTSTPTTYILTITDENGSYDTPNLMAGGVDLSNYYTKDETYSKAQVDSLVSAVYKYKGSVATYNDLPSTDLTVGDVYNVEDTGDNYAWTGTDWDKLSGTVDLSNYYNKTETDTLLGGKQDTLVSGTNIKTVNNQSLLGNGNIDTTPDLSNYYTKSETEQEIVNGFGENYITTGKVSGSNVGSRATIEGSENIASAARAFVCGYQNTASGLQSFVANYYNTASAYASAALGKNNVAGYEAQFVAGKFNNNKADTLFEVGNGTANNRSNALEVYADGTVVGGKSTVAADDNKTLTTKDYVDSSVANKQNTLVSGTNIKTINGSNILGSGDLKTIYTFSYSADDFVNDDPIALPQATIDGIINALENEIPVCFIYTGSSTFNKNVMLATKYSLDENQFEIGFLSLYNSSTIFSTIISLDDTDPDNLVYYLAEPTETFWDTSNFVTLDSTQTITGQKTFNDVIALSTGKAIKFGTNVVSIESSADNYTMNIRAAQNVIVRVGSANYAIRPFAKNLGDLGSSSFTWRRLYIGEFVGTDKNANYGIAPPDTTGWTANKTIATAAISGSGAPTTATKADYVGQEYVDTASTPIDMYKCVAITDNGGTIEYTWRQISLV